MHLRRLQIRIRLFQLRVLLLQRLLRRLNLLRQRHHPRLRPLRPRRRSLKLPLRRRKLLHRLLKRQPRRRPLLVQHLLPPRRPLRPSVVVLNSRHLRLPPRRIQPRRQHLALQLVHLLLRPVRHLLGLLLRPLQRRTRNPRNQLPLKNLLPHNHQILGNRPIARRLHPHHLPRLHLPLQAQLRLAHRPHRRRHRHRCHRLRRLPHPIHNRTRGHRQHHHHAANECPFSAHEPMVQ